MQKQKAPPDVQIGNVTGDEATIRASKIVSSPLSDGFSEKLNNQIVLQKDGSLGFPTMQESEQTKGKLQG